MREGLAEPVERIFGLQVLQGLELRPFRDVVLELLDFGLDEGEGPFEGVVRKTRELGYGQQSSDGNSTRRTSEI